MTPGEDTTSTTEPDAAATAAAIGRDEHTFGLRGVPGSRLNDHAELMKWAAVFAGVVERGEL